MMGFMGRGARTNKHVYCSRREVPDPGGAVEPLPPQPNPPGVRCSTHRPRTRPQGSHEEKTGTDLSSPAA